MRPIFKTFGLFSVNQTLPSGPAVMPIGLLKGVGIANSVIAPAGVMRPIRLASYSRNQTLPSGPPVIAIAGLDVGGNGNSVTTPVVVIRPIALAAKAHSVNHRLPSGPEAMEHGNLDGLGSGNLVMICAEATVATSHAPARKIRSRPR